MPCYSGLLPLLLLTAAVCGCASNAPRNSEAPLTSSEPTGLASLLPGTWELKSRVVGGKEMPFRAGSVFLIITKEGMLQDHVLNGETWQTGSTIVGNVFFRLDQTSDPITIDSAGMADWSKLRRGICRLENDTLTICKGRVDDPRPTEFTSGDSPGQGNILTVYKRVSDRS